MLKLFNTLTQQKEIFEPITPGHVGMYVCGPTVSGESHLGHARPYISFDVLHRYLLFKKYKVRYVRNITDAGHFEEEGRVADDKISAKALIEKLQPMELVHKYTQLFHQAMTQLNVLEPHIEPTATGHIIEQIEMIEKIIAAGFAYCVNGSVYFAVEKYNTHFSQRELPYGILSKRNLIEQQNNSRTLNQQDEKRSPFDFALWKNAPPQHIMRWKSPWGYGFPGWHIECSAMSAKYLGTQFDIHGGGMDLMFPHHECEIAQSVVSNQTMPARYWIHNNMITINGKKMGKSYNNVIKLNELFTGTHPLLEKAYSPMTIRFFILQTHYKSTLDFGNEALQAAEKGWNKLNEAYSWLQQLPIQQLPSTPHPDFNEDLDRKTIETLNELEPFMDDDLNTAKVLANLFKLVPVLNAFKHKQLPFNALPATTFETLKTTTKLYIETILGMQTDTTQHTQLNQVVDLLVELRQAAKQNKDYKTSDSIRNRLHALSIELKDEKDGSTTYNVIV